MKRILTAILALLLPCAALAQTAGTMNLQGPSTSPGAPQITPLVLDAAINAQLTSKLDYVGAYVALAGFALDRTGASDVTTGLQAFLTAIPAAGGTIVLEAGTYKISSALVIPANTHLLCQPGATLKAATAWNGATKMIANANNAAVSLTDHDITIEGCGFDWTALTPAAGQQSIYIRMAQHIRIVRVHCQGGSDCTTLLASNDTLVSDSYSAGTANACWNHFEAPTNGVVRNNVCFSTAFGILVTGTNSTASSAGVATHFHLTGNSITLTGTGGTGIWLQGGGTAGSGASFTDATDNEVLAGSGALCVKVSGAGAQNVVTNTRCTGGNGTAQAIYSGGSGDSGGVPSATRIKGGLLDTWNAGTNPLITLSGADDGVEGVKSLAGTYTYAITLAGTNQFAASNAMPAGASGIYSLTGTGYTLIEPTVGLVWIPSLNFGGAAVGITYSQRAGTIWLDGKVARVCLSMTLTSKGSSAGAATITGLPYTGIVTAPTTGVQNIPVALAQNFTATTAMVAAVPSASTTIALATDITRTTAVADTAFQATSTLAMCGSYSIQ